MALGGFPPPLVLVSSSPRAPFGPHPGKPIGGCAAALYLGSSAKDCCRRICRGGGSVGKAPEGPVGEIGSNPRPGAPESRRLPSPLGRGQPGTLGLRPTEGAPLKAF